MIKYITIVENVSELNEEEKKALVDVEKTYPFRTNDYYLRNINWDDKDDPIKKIVIPDISELSGEGAWDISDELISTKQRGVQHKFKKTCVLLVSKVCGSICRFCFRKRLFRDDNHEVDIDISEGLKYIGKHQEVDNVLLSGGDPLMLNSEKLLQILRELSQMNHIKVIRIGTKLPLFNPHRILEDNSLLSELQQLNRKKQLYIMIQVNHPTELTDEAMEAIHKLRYAGCKIYNQTPLLRGINDNVDTLSVLLNKLVYNGITPYYIFQCKPTKGNQKFSVPIMEAIDILDKVRENLSGLSNTFRYIMVNKTGKIEIVGKCDGKLVVRCHETYPESENVNKIKICDINKNTKWIDEFEIP